MRIHLAKKSFFTFIVDYTIPFSPARLFSVTFGSFDYNVILYNDIKTKITIDKSMVAESVLKSIKITTHQKDLFYARPNYPEQMQIFRRYTNDAYRATFISN